ncbi:MAG: hypothetical protein ABIQ53_00640 [Terracoccus sp.]
MAPPVEQHGEAGIRRDGDARGEAQHVDDHCVHASTLPDGVAREGKCAVGSPLDAHRVAVLTVRAPHPA